MVWLSEHTRDLFGLGQEIPPLQQTTAIECNHDCRRVVCTALLHALRRVRNRLGLWQFKCSICRQEDGLLTSQSPRTPLSHLFLQLLNSHAYPAKTKAIAAVYIAFTLTSNSSFKLQGCSRTLVPPAKKPRQASTASRAFDILESLTRSWRTLALSACLRPPPTFLNQP